MVVRHQTTIDVLLHRPGSAVGQELYRRGRQVESEAKRRCPVDKGRLRASITTNPPERVPSGLVVRVGSDVRYAFYVHEGTSVMRGRPFLREALEQIVRST